MDLQNIFLQLGLKEEHMKVYLANLEWGETIITNVARKSKLPRTTTYLLIKDLQNIGLVTQSMKQGKTIYVPASPEYLEVLLRKKQAELDNSISELKTKMADIKVIQNTNPNKPKVEFLEGADGIMQAYDRTFDAKEIWIQCLAESYTDVVSEKFFDEYFEKFYKKTSIKSKEILKLEDEEYINLYGSAKNLQLRVPIKESTETDFWVYDNKVTFVSFNKERPYAFIIEDESIAKAAKNLFDLAWRQAKNEDPRIKAGKTVKTEF